MKFLKVALIAAILCSCNHATLAAKVAPKAPAVAVDPAPEVGKLCDHLLALQLAEWKEPEDQKQAFSIYYNAMCNQVFETAKEEEPKKYDGYTVCLMKAKTLDEARACPVPEDEKPAPDAGQPSKG